jgi:hypothetical protein
MSSLLYVITLYQYVFILQCIRFNSNFEGGISSPWLNLFLLNRTMPWLFIWQLQLNRESMWDSGDKLQRNNERSQFLITGLHEGCLCLSLLLVCFRFHNALIALCFILYEKMFWKRATILGFMHGKCQS